VRGARLPFEALAVDGPLSLTPSLAWQLRTRLLHGLDRSGVPVLPEAPGAAECAALPPGAAGLAVWQTLCSETLALWQYHQNLRLGEPQCININLDIDAPPIRLSGQVLIHAGQLIERVAAVPQARHLVHAWVRALALAAMEVDAQDLVLLGLGQDGPRHVVLRLPPAATAQLHIAELLAAAAGAWSRPLAFTPELALALLEGGERDAHWRWIGSERAPGESQQPVNRWLWAGADPTAPENLPELRWLGERLLPAGLRRAWRRQWPP
jgi:exonuclease V gamma subunit